MRLCDSKAIAPKLQPHPAGALGGMVIMACGAAMQPPVFAKGYILSAAPLTVREISEAMSRAPRAGPSLNTEP